MSIYIGRYSKAGWRCFERLGMVIRNVWHGNGLQPVTWQYLVASAQKCNQVTLQHSSSDKRGLQTFQKEIPWLSTLPLNEGSRRWGTVYDDLQARSASYMTRSYAAIICSSPILTATHVRSHSVVSYLWLQTLIRYEQVLLSDVFTSLCRLCFFRTFPCSWHYTQRQISTE